MDLLCIGTLFTDVFMVSITIGDKDMILISVISIMIDF